MKRFELEIVLTEPMLGSVPKDKDVYGTHVANRAALTDEALAEELESVEHVEEKGWTGFHTETDSPFIYDYVIKGFFKSACYFMRQVTDSKSKKLAAFKKKIDGLVMVYPRKLFIEMAGPMSQLERPLRAETARGPRVCLARSDVVPPGSKIACEIVVLGVIPETMLREWLDYGQFMGLGQWRSGGYGRFTYTLKAM